MPDPYNRRTGVEPFYDVIDPNYGHHLIITTDFIFYCSSLYSQENIENTLKNWVPLHKRVEERATFDQFNSSRYVSCNQSFNLFPESAFYEDGQKLRPLYPELSHWGTVALAYGIVVVKIST
jgi:hypothetical protein